MSFALAAAMLAYAAPCLAIDDGAAQAPGSCAAAADILARVLAEPLIVAAPQPAVPPDRANGSVDSGISLLSAPVWLHQTLISPQDGDRCVFAPSCSTYAARALRARGLAGWPMAADRILRCHQGAHGRYPYEDGRSLDPLPAPGRPTLSLAGGAASLVPGLGQWLAGDRGDALYALGSVAFLAWGASHYAARDQPGPAVALGGLGAFFYVGSVYGGARAVASGPAH